MFLFQVDQFFNYNKCGPKKRVRSHDSSELSEECYSPSQSESGLEEEETENVGVNGGGQQSLATAYQ